MGGPTTQDHLDRLVNEQLTESRVTQAIDAWHEAQPAEPDPVITHHPIDPELQTGESQLLGGAMEIRSPWPSD
jgi:hypothetical protein